MSDIHVYRNAVFERSRTTTPFLAVL